MSLSSLEVLAQVQLKKEEKENTFFYTGINLLSWHALSAVAAVLNAKIFLS